MAFAAPVFADLAEVAAEAGDPEAAGEAAAALAGISALTERNLQRAMAALAQAWFAVAAGRAPDGEKAAREAADLLAGTAFGCLRARALVALGRATEGTGRADGVDCLAEAAALFEASGALWRRDRALDALRSKGSAGRRAADAALGPSGVTAREWEVAHLADQRLTAQEIADRLFISRRTVETHLAHVYAKLGVASKSELAARLAELGRPAPG